MSTLGRQPPERIFDLSLAKRRQSRRILADNQLGQDGTGRDGRRTTVNLEARVGNRSRVRRTVELPVKYELVATDRIVHLDLAVRVLKNAGVTRLAKVIVESSGFRGVTHRATRRSCQKEPPLAGLP